MIRSNRKPLFLAGVCLLVLLLGMTTASAMTQLTLPSGMTEVEEEAFADVSTLESVVVPETVTAICSKAFANCELTYVTVYNSVSYIADDAFDGNDGMIACVNAGSYAYTWFLNKGYSIMPLDVYATLSGMTCEIPTWSVVSSAWPGGSQGILYDISTGKSFKIKRWAGGNHADIETLTTEDTQVFASIYGVSDANDMYEDYSAASGYWEPRACLLITTDGHLYACSLQGVPHNYPSGDTTPNNGMNGQLCLWFTDSWGHSNTSTVTNTVKKHRAAVTAAYTWWKDNFQ